MVNTSDGIYRGVGAPGERRGGGETMTSAVVEDDLVYVDEEPEIVSVSAACGWFALFDDGYAAPLVGWAVLDNGTVYGITRQGGSVIDATLDVGQEDGFKRYVHRDEIEED